MGTIYEAITGSFWKYITICSVSLCIGFYIGFKYELNKNKAEEVKILQETTIKTAKLQDAINSITDRQNAMDLQNTKKYGDLQNAFNNEHSNLAKCMLDRNELRNILNSANQQVRITPSASRNIATNAESITNYSCRDLGLTTIEHDKMYFQCKSKLDAAQGIIRQILQTNH